MLSTRDPRSPPCYVRRYVSPPGSGGITSGKLEGERVVETVKPAYTQVGHATSHGMVANWVMWHAWMVVVAPLCGLGAAKRQGGDDGRRSLPVVDGSSKLKT